MLCGFTHALAGISGQRFFRFHKLSCPTARKKIPMVLGFK